MTVKHYLHVLRVLFTVSVLAVIGMCSKAHATEVTPPILPDKPPVYTLVIIHETYHGTSNLALRGYPTRKLCEREVAHVKQEGVRMSWEKDTDFLYTDAYCVRSYQ